MRCFPCNSRADARTSPEFLRPPACMARMLLRVFPSVQRRTGGIPMNSKRTITVDAEPYAYEFEPAHCALVIIDMQRDFLEPGGFGEMLGNDVSQLRRTIAPNQQLLAAWREEGFKVIHTREGHRSEMG